MEAGCSDIYSVCIVAVFYALTTELIVYSTILCIMDGASYAECEYYDLFPLAILLTLLDVLFSSYVYSFIFVVL